MRRTRLTLALALVAGSAVVGIPAAATPAQAADGDVIQLVAMNDFHGRISPQSGGDGSLVTATGPDNVYGTSDDVSQTVGGAANIATTLAQIRAGFAPGAANSFFVGAGDLVSASPFNSSVFRDEPTIEVLNALGLDYSSVGNHEFDRGQEELLRISGATDGEASDDVTACEGVTPEVDGCFTNSAGVPFEGADFPYLAANVIDDATGESILPAYEIVTDARGNKVGLIGVVTDDTPNIVSPDGIEGLTFLTEAQGIDQAVTDMQAEDPTVQAIAVMIHEGGTQTTGGYFNGCAGALAGTPIAAINAAITTEVDVIISAHTHVPYNCTLPDSAGNQRLVTQAGFYGKVLSDIRMTVDASGEINRTPVSAGATATNVPVLQGSPDPAIQSIVGYWEGRAAEAGSVPVGSQTADLDRAYRGGAPVRDAESALGNLVADAQLAYARDTDSLGGDDVDVAFMNPGGLRADINCLSTGPADPDGNINFGETFAVQPFSNTVNTVELTGAGIEQVLEQQWATRSGAASFLQLSVAGLTYEFNPAAAAGSRVDPASILIGGQPLVLTQTYLVAANSFLIAGGDSFAAFVSGRPGGATVVTGANDVDAFNAYVAGISPVSPPALDRAVSLDPAQTFDDDGSGAGPCNPPVPTTPGGGGSTPGTPGTPGTQPVANPGNGIAAGNLANTGAATGQLTALGAGLLLAGVVATAAGYRRGRGVTE
ncbi:MAG: bifunctional metallophosphatase/5'-nucleotidase [Actinobacteria bacterium]|uniref:Unannotated protein n=1 Tax=freshwater metagenome TaxID=449393 RepID=A0A6J7GRT2_9ZZZZ|nr:bifunctional metallophosphatase/5'-nucleotidase [Actinomycetota bacterium]